MKPQDTRWAALPVVMVRQAETAAQLRFPYFDIEITGRLAKPRGRMMQPDRLYVEVRDARACLHARGVDSRLRLLTPPAGGRSIRPGPRAPFAFTRHLGGIGISSPLPHLPHMTAGRLVLRRQTWRMPAAGTRRPDAGRGGAEFRAVQGLRERLRLPRHVFAKLPGEPKPPHVDLYSPLLVRQLCRSARQTGELFEFSEVSADPDHLRLQVEGRPYTTELRCAVFSGTPASSTTGN